MEIVRWRYNFYPTDAEIATYHNQQHQPTHISEAIRNILRKGNFLHGGVDEEVSPDKMRRNVLTSAHRDVPTTLPMLQSRNSRCTYTSLLRGHSQLNAKRYRVKPWLWLQLLYVPVLKLCWRP